MQQLFDALGYLHDQKIMHRDIKSSNILISNKLYLKLADFGLARSVDNIYSHPAILGGEGADAFDYDYHEPTRSSASSVGNRRGGIGSSSSTSGGGRMDGSMHSSQLEPQYTNNVITMWYRPPEVLLGAVSYGCGVDVWSAGCVLAEMAIMRPLMPGKTEMEQFDMICRLTGTPSEATWPDISQLPHAEYMLGEVAKYTSDIRSTLTNVVSSSVIDILERILVHDPSRRCSARAALGMRFFHACPKPHEMPPLSVPGGASFHEFETLHKRRTTETTAAAPSDTHPPSTHVSSGGSTSGLGGAGSISTSVVSSGGSSSSSSNSSGSGAPKSGWSEATFTTSGGASKPHGLPGSYAAALMRPGDSGTSAQNIQKLPRSDPPSSRFGSMPPHHGQGSGYNAPAISTAAPANTSGTAGSYAHEAKRPRYDNWSSGTRR
jgi:serine/threonine protein kinase